jgi:hypothetical protein
VAPTSAYEAVLVMRDDADTRAPGGAITMALCGSLDHEPPCPLAPHHTSTSRGDDHTTVRTVFAARPGHEGEVHRRIGAALAAGGFTGPDGVHTVWRVDRAGPSAVLAEERQLADNLAAHID